MTNRAPTDLVEKGADVDMLPRIAWSIAQRLMERNVETRCGADYEQRSPERHNHRNSYRERTRESRASAAPYPPPSSDSAAPC